MKTWGEMNWTEMMLSMGEQQAESFRLNNMSYMNMLATGKSFRYVLGTIYQTLINRKGVLKMELLPTTEKQRLFEIIKDFSPEGYTKDDFISACKALYTLEYFLNPVNETNT